jgi:hypothetical protein
VKPEASASAADRTGAAHPAPSEPSPGRASPRLLSLTAALVGLQGLGLVAVTVFLVVEIVVATTTSYATAIAITVCAALAAAALLAVARALLAGRRWGRAPAVITQLFLVPVAISMLQGERWYVGAPLIAWAVAVLVLLFTPPVLHATTTD